MKILISIILALFLPFISQAAELKIHSNGNLKSILMEISHYYQTRHPEWKVVIETGKISEIKEKLEAGADGDLLIGDEKLFEMASEIKAIDNASRQVLFTDPVVAVADIDSEIELTDPKEINADNFKKIALLGEKSPLGKLVRAYLGPKGLKDAPAEKKVDVADTKAALDAVKTGEAKWTLVYSSAASKRKLKRLFQVPGSDIPEVSFSVAIINRTQNKEQAVKFIEIMQSTIARKFFENAGFLLSGSSNLVSNQTQTRPKKQTQAQTQTQPQTQTQSQTQPQTQTAPQTQAKPQEETKPEKQAQTKPDQKKKKKKKKKDKDKE